ncbi:MAG: SDR family NAD(P)-dependent oxidoreductase [Clostridiales bacterium]|nr:SDR family NAD(P)-dependent oxidoreductase [Clostridiales bacterium]
MNKKALITGASRGIGRSAALLFASHGYDLYLTCKSRLNLLEELQDTIRSRFLTECTIFRCDVGNYEEVKQLFSQIDRLDLLINNAGVSYIGLLSEMSASDWNNLIRTNLSGVFHTCKCAIPLFLQKECGRIINISSVWGNVGASMEAAYSASKGGINALTKALAKELGPSGIPVNAIAYGMIDTEMNQCFTKEERAAICEEIPADRIALPEEAAEMILSLAEAPAYLTGQIITFDGGWT